MVNKLPGSSLAESGILEEGVPEGVFGKGHGCWMRGMEGERAGQ